MLVGAAAGLWLLQALGDFLRPVLVALLLCYTIWPIHTRLQRMAGPWLSLLIIGAVLFGLSLRSRRAARV